MPKPYPWPDVREVQDIITQFNLDIFSIKVYESDPRESVLNRIEKAIVDFSEVYLKIAYDKSQGI